MREILFRGRTEYDMWFYGYLTKSQDVFTIQAEDIFGAFYEEDVIPETIGQWTGLLDKNGDKIFEGDIVKGLFKYGGAVNSVVEFREGSFGLKWYRGKVEMFWAFPTICNVEYEVIGNIHDNPEMLEDSDD